MLRSKHDLMLSHGSIPIHLVHVNGKINQAVGITPFVVVPCDQLDEIVVQSDACTNIENRGCLACHEICRHHLLIGPLQNSLHWSFSSRLHSSDDLLVTGPLVQTTSQVHH